MREQTRKKREYEKRCHVKRVMKDLSTVKYTPEQRRKIFAWMDTVNPIGFTGMVPKLMPNTFPEGCEPKMKTQIVEGYPDNDSWN